MFAWLAEAWARGREGGRERDEKGGVINICEQESLRILIV